MWNSLVRQSILVQTGAEDYTLQLPSGSGVVSFNTRTGVVQLTAADVATALGFTPLSGVSVQGGQLTSTGGQNPTLGLPVLLAPGTATSANITVDSFGRIVAYSSGSSGVGVAIGGAITSATVAGGVLYDSGPGTLAENAALTFNGGSKLKIGVPNSITGVLELCANSSTVGVTLSGGSAGTLAMEGSNWKGTFSPDGLFVASGTISITLSVAPATVVNGSVSGTATCTQPDRGTYDKTVVIHCNAFDGTNNYNFPTAFTFAPATVANQTSAGLTVTTSAVTISTGSATTGFIILKGF
jgi:hypothetical protein